MLTENFILARFLGGALDQTLGFVATHRGLA